MRSLHVVLQASPAVATIVLTALVLTACTSDLGPGPQVGITPQIFNVTVNAPTPGPSPTPVPTIAPSPTANTLAARVNDQPITLDQYDAEMARYLAASASPVDPNSVQGRRLASQLKDGVLDALVEQTLIEQEAARSGVIVTEQQIDEEIMVARQRAGGESGYRAWLTVNRMTEQDGRDLARRELLTNAMRDRLLTQLPRTAEYVHGYHIVVGTEGEARRVLQQLQNGAMFSALAQSLSIDDSTRAAGGDLGWFTRNAGSILWAEVEEAAFFLQPGQTSDVIVSPVGFHIVKVTERQTRALTEVDAAYMQEQAMTQWIADLKARAKIERYV
jgi:parvulin-like peptidyl-prolyl isomerase